MTQIQLPQLNALNHVHSVAFATFAGPDETWQMSANLALEVKRSIFETLLAGEIPSTNLFLLQDFNCSARKYERVVGSLAICLTTNEASGPFRLDSLVFAVVVDTC